VDPSTFKVGPKVKLQSQLAEKPRPSDKSRPSIALPVKLAPERSSQAIHSRQVPQKSVVERALPTTSRSTSRSISPSPRTKKLPNKPKSNLSAQSSRKPVGTDTKSRLVDAFIPNQLIPLAQGPKRDLRTIEEIQNDLWRKKGKNYPSVNGGTKHSRPMNTQGTVKSVKRRRESSESEDSFVVSEEEEKTDEIDYRAEIRAMFKRKGNRRVDLSDDDSDMEASGFEMAKEEARAAKLARMEDEEEIRREEERVREKKRRKMEAEKKKDGK
jgi:hypothetical protein